MRQALLATLLLLNCSATLADSPWRARINLSVGDVVIANTSHGNTLGSGEVINGFEDGRLSQTRMGDYTWGLGFSIARPFGRWNVESELLWRYRTDWDMMAPSPRINTVTNVFGNVATTSMLINVTRTGSLTAGWEWELGAGAGLVYNNIDAEFLEREVPGVSPEFKVTSRRGKTSASFSAIVGLQRQLNNGWRVLGRLRYIDLGKLETGPFPDRAVRVEADHRSTELQFSLERRL